MQRRLLSADADLTRRLRVAEKPGVLRSLAVVFAHSGDSWLWIPALGLVWLFGPPKWKPVAAWMLAGVLVTALIVLAIKFSVRRRRPEGEWGELYRRTDPHSFPSGHAARAVMLAVMALGLAPPWLGVLLLFWASLVILARVAMGVHYLSDVLAGAALGALLGLIYLALIPQLSSLA
jgi:undecaprenyl-diphosphatase